VLRCVGRSQIRSIGVSERQCRRAQSKEKRAEQRRQSRRGVARGMRVCCEPCQESEEGEEDVFDEGVEGRKE
jgi:hypothetical protein